MRLCAALSGIAACAVLATPLFAQPLPLPFEESFASAELDPAWRVDAAPGNTVSVTGGALRLDAAGNSYAHVQRVLDEDLIRAIATIEPDHAVTWAPSLFLYWNPGNWCQVSVINRGGGEVHAAEMIDGKFIEHALGNRPFAGAHEVGIELAVDCIRFISRRGDAWVTEATLARPEQFRPAPSLLIAGKGFGGTPDAQEHDLNNTYRDPGNRMSSAILNVRVERLGLERAMETPQERETRLAALADTWGEQELAAAEDPSFESVARHFPPLKFSREAVGVKDHPQAIGIAADGALQPNDGIAETSQPIAFFEIGEPGYRFGSGQELPAKRLHDGYMPMVIATDSHAGIAMEQTAFGHSAGMTTSAPLAAYVQLKLTGAAPSEQTVRLVVRQGEADRELKRWRISIPADGSNTIAIRFPYEFERFGVEDVSADEFEARMAEVTAYWRDLIATGTRFIVPDQRVQDAYRAWLAYNFLNVKERDGIRHICDGSGFYNVIYGYSAALYCHVLDLVGYSDIAREYLDEMLTLQQPDGLWYLNFGHTDTGTIMKVIAEHYRITRDAEWLRRTSPRLMAMADWISEHRKDSMRSVHARRSPVHGLIRFRPYCDYEAPAYDYYSNAYLCVGLEEIAGVLAEIGMTSESKRLAGEAREYRADILASMNASIITRDGMRMLPLMPENQFLLKETNYTANGYYGLIASCVLETGFLPADDARTQLLMDMLRKRGGLTAGLCRFFDQIDHAYTYGYWNTCMERDEVKPLILGLYASLAYGMSRGTYSAVECTAIRTGENAHTLPHTYSNTKQVRLLRNMLVREQGEQLLLAHYTPRPWLAPGKRLAVEDAPTSFGLVSYSIAAGENEMHVKLSPPAKHAPSAIRLRIRHPQGGAIQAVEGLDRGSYAVEGDVIALARATGPLEFRVRY
jgi:hypothetical protein